MDVTLTIFEILHLPCKKNRVLFICCQNESPLVIGVEINRQILAPLFINKIRSSIMKVTHYSISLTFRFSTCIERLVYSKLMKVIEMYFAREGWIYIEKAIC